MYAVDTHSSSLPTLITPYHPSRPSSLIIDPSSLVSSAACPDVCLQMLIRGANAVGYTSYPDNGK